MDTITYRKSTIKFKLEHAVEEKIKFGLHVYKNGVRICDITKARLGLISKGNFSEYVIYIQRKNEDMDDVQFYFNFNDIEEIYIGEGVAWIDIQI